MEKEEIEVKDFYFRQLRKVNIGNPASTDADRCSLVCVSNKFGLTFVSIKNGVLVFKTSCLHDVDKDDTIGPKKVNADVASLSPTLLATPSPPLHVALSSDNLTLSVCVLEGGLLMCYFFDTRALSQGKGKVIAPFDTFQLATERGIGLSCLTWNPAVDEVLVVSLTSGVLQLIHVKEKATMFASKADLHANAICWSPKGKQFAVGLKSGKILQLSPKTLDVKKEFPCPEIFNGVDQQVTDLFWVSTYEFAVVYTPLDPGDKVPFLVFLSAPKDQQPVFTNWEDIYYGGGTKENKFFFNYISDWKVLITSSANALEAVVFAQKANGESVWQKWELEDTGRAEVPLQDGNETYPVGMALDLTSQHEVPISETLVLPPCPLLLLYSDHGVLCPFTVIKTTALAEALKVLVTPPLPVPNDASLIRQPQKSSTPATSTVASSSSAVPTTIVQSPSSLPGLSTQSSFSFTPVSLGAPRLVAPMGVQISNTLAPTQIKPQVSTLPQTFVGLAPSISSHETEQRVQMSLNQTIHKGNMTGPPMLSAGIQTPVSQSLTNKPPSFLQQQQPGAQVHVLGSQQFGGSTMGTLQLKTGGPFFGTNFGTQPTTSLVSNTKPSVSQSIGVGQPSSAVIAQSKSPGVQQLSGNPPSLLQPATALQSIGSKPLQLSNSQPLLSRVPPPQNHGAIFLQSSGSSPNVVPQAPSVMQHTASSQALISTSIGARPPASQTSASTQPSRPTQPSQQSTQIVQPLLKFAPPSGSWTCDTCMVNNKAEDSKCIACTASKPGSSQPLASVGHRQLVNQPPHPPSMYRLPGPQLGGQAPLPQSVGPLSTQLPAGSHATGIRPPPVYKTPPATHPSLGGASVAVLSSSQQPPLSERPQPQSEQRRRIETSGQSLQPSGGRSQPGTRDNTEALSHRQVEADFADKIQEEIDWYTDELEELKAQMLDVFGQWEGVGDKDSMGLGNLGKTTDFKNICDEVYKVEAKVVETKKKCEALQRKCDTVEENVLKGYEIYEEARNNLRKKTDPNNVSLLKLRPLDRYSSNRLNDIRSSFIQAEQSITEVNSQLDAQLEEMYERKRQAGRDLLKAPSIQTVYSTLRNHHRITRMQSKNINGIVRDMKQLQLIPRSWQPSDVLLVQPGSPSFSPQTTPSKPTPKQPQLRESDEVVETRKMSKDKVKKLREAFGNMTVTPVRTVRPAPLYTCESGRDTPQSYTQSDASQIVASGSYHSGTTTPLESSRQESPEPPSFDLDSTRLTHYPITTSVLGKPLSDPSQSSLGSQLSLSTQPDVVAGLNQKVSVRTPHGFKNVDSMPAPPPPRVNRQSSIDVQASPEGKISYMTPLGFQQQKDPSQSPRHPSPQQKPQTQSPSKIQGGTVHWGSPTTTAPSQQQTPSYVSPRSVLGSGATAAPPPGPRVPLPTFKVIGLSQKSPVHTSANSAQPAPSKPPVSAPPLPPPSSVGGGISFSSSPSFSFLGSKLSGSGPLNFSSTSKPPGIQSSGSSVAVSTFGELKRSDPLGDLTSIRSSAGATGLNLGVHNSASSPNISISQSEMPPYSQSPRPLSSTTASITKTGPPSTAVAQSPKSLSLQTPVFGISSVTTSSHKVNPSTSGPAVTQPQFLFGLNSQPKPAQSSSHTSSSTSVSSAVVTTASGPGTTQSFVFGGVPNFSFSAPRSKTATLLTPAAPAGTSLFGSSTLTGLSLVPSIKSTTTTTTSESSLSSPLATTTVMSGSTFSGLPTMSSFKFQVSDATTTVSSTTTSGPAATSLNLGGSIFSSIPPLGSGSSQFSSLGSLSTGSKSPFAFGTSSASSKASAIPSAPFVFGIKSTTTTAVSTTPQVSTSQPPPVSSTAVTGNKLQFNGSQLLKAASVSQKPKVENEEQQQEEKVVEKKDTASLKLDPGAHSLSITDKITSETSTTVVTKPVDGGASVQSENKSESRTMAPKPSLVLPTVTTALSTNKEQSEGDIDTILKDATSRDSEQGESPTPEEDKDTPLASRDDSNASVLSGPSEREVVQETGSSSTNEEELTTVDQEVKPVPQSPQTSTKVQEVSTTEPGETTQDNASVLSSQKEDVQTKVEKESEPKQPTQPDVESSAPSPVKEKPTDIKKSTDDMPPSQSSSGQTNPDPPVMVGSATPVPGDRSTPHSIMDEADDDEMGEMEENNVETSNVKTSQEQSSLFGGGGGFLSLGGLGGRPSNSSANPFGSSTLQQSLSVGSTQLDSATGPRPSGGGFLRPSLFGGSGLASQTTRSGLSGDSLNLGSSSTSSLGATPQVSAGGGPVFGLGPSFGQAPAFGSPPQMPTGSLFGGRPFGSAGTAQQSQPLGGGGFQSSSSGLTFGNLAQQQSSGIGGRGGGTAGLGSGTNSGSMGGSSFNQWR